MNDSDRIARRRATRTGCAVEATMSVLGGVWKPVLVFHLLDGRLRFNALCRLTPNATPRMITLQLRELEADGVIRRIVYPEVPPKVEYELTDFGRTLEPVLVSLRDWGEAFQMHQRVAMSRRENSTRTTEPAQFPTTSGARALERSSGTISVSSML